MGQILYRWAIFHGPWLNNQRATLNSAKELLSFLDHGFHLRRGLWLLLKTRRSRLRVHDNHILQSRNRLAELNPLEMDNQKWLKSEFIP